MESNGHSAVCCVDARPIQPCCIAEGRASTYEQQTACRPPISISHRVMPVLNENCHAPLRGLWSILLRFEDFPTLPNLPFSASLKLYEIQTDLVIFPDMRFVVQHRIQQRTMDFDFSVVADVALFSKPVHKKADAGSGCTDHIRQYFLAEGNRDGLCASFAEIRQKKEKACEPSFTRIKKLIDQIFLDPAIA